ncbi:MAG: 50S ribosomal protein L3, partial [Methanobacteriota archaeon]
MARHPRPRSGSLAYTPRKRAKKQTPSMRSWPKSDEAKLLGFAGYKAGMTHIIATDNNKNSSSSGLDVQVPITVLETPPMFVLGLRAYAKGYWGRETMTDIWALEIPKEILKKLKLSKGENPEKKLDELSKNDKLVDVTVIVCTQPTLASLPKKKPDVMEMAIGGSISDKIGYAKQILGKTVSVKDVFEENNNTDVCAITKGKGFQG